jgi:hypothetical protein
MTYSHDLSKPLAQANLDLNRFFELQDARFNIELIEAKYAELEHERTRAIERADHYENKVNENASAAKIYGAMMECVREYSGVREAFEEFLAIMRLADPEIEQKMTGK